MWETVGTRHCPEMVKMENRPAMPKVPRCGGPTLQKTVTFKRNLPNCRFLEYA